MESISIREAADRLGVSHKVIRRLVSQGTLEAYKRPGSHGAEWRVEVASLLAYQSGQSAPRHGSPTRVRLSAPSPSPTTTDEHLEADAWHSDKEFLQGQILRLTDLLAVALGRPASNTPEPMVEVQGAHGESTVTSALQSSLEAVRQEGIAGIELCSIKVLWGRPVLWRTNVTDADDVATLVDAIMSDAAQWKAPGEELVYIWALGAEREVLWGTACGPGWFGPEFEEALRNCRVERR